MNQRFTLDRKSFEQFLAALCLVQQLNNQAAYKPSPNHPNHAFISLLQLQRTINSGTVDLQSVMAGVVKLVQSVIGASAAGIWLFRDAAEFSCCERIGTIYDPARLGVDILAHLASSNQADSNSCAFSRTLRKGSRYPGYPNSVAIAALRVNSKIVGAVAAFSTGFDAFGGRDLENLHFLAGLLERALQKAMQAGYREAVALEHSALLRVLENIGPRLNGFEPQLSVPKHQHVAEPIEDSAESPERVVYTRLQQPAPSPALCQDSAETGNRGSKTSDISLPGIGVRAALGDVREFTGEEQPFFLWEAIRRGGVRARGLAASCRSGAGRMSATVTLKLRNSAAHLATMPGRLLQRRHSGSLVGSSSIISRGRNAFTHIVHWRLKIRLAALPRFRWSRSPHFEKQWFRNARSRSLSQLRSFSMKSRTMLMEGKDRFSYVLRLARVEGRSTRRELRQTQANISAVVAHQRVRMRVAQRRQKGILANSAEIAGGALQNVGGSLAEMASSAGRSTIAAFATLRVRASMIDHPGINRRALKRSASAIAVLAIMTIFLVLLASVRHSFQFEPVSAASASTAPAARITAPVTLAGTTAQPAPGPSSHLEITDASVADTLHDLTRYEIVTLQRAAEYGDDEAAFQLGMAYETGYYVRQNCSKAAHWVKIAADSGNPAAAYNLGLRYRNGDGLQADESAAEHWLRMASAQRYSPNKLALATVR